MQKTVSSLFINYDYCILQALDSTIAAQKVSMADQGAEIKTDSAQYLAGLEEKLSGLQAELHAVETDYAALLARVNACCHNETYYLAAVKDNVNAILAEVCVLKMFMQFWQLS
jgi:hypothetical protein